MPQITLYFSAGLIALGTGSWMAAGMTSITALIPAFFGVVLGLTGVVAMREQLRKHAMHVAAMVALLGTIGALMRAIPTLVSGETLRLATLSQLTMGLGMIVFLILCVRSFIAARRARD